MSMMLMAKAMSVRVGNPLRKLVLLKLADQANDQAQCWPSYQSIADACEISRRSAVSHIEWLEAHGFLVRQRRKKEAGENFSNVFILTLDKGSAPSANAAPPSANAAPPSANAAPPSANAAPGVVQMLHPNQSIRNSQINSQGNILARDARTCPLADARTDGNENPDTPKRSGGKPKAFDGMAALLDLGVAAQVAADWLEVRKGKRAKLTQTALDALVREAGKAGISTEEAVRICAERGWQSFNAGWDWRGAPQHGGRSDGKAKSRHDLPTEYTGGTTDEQLMREEWYAMGETQ